MTRIIEDAEPRNWVSFVGDFAGGAVYNTTHHQVPAIQAIHEVEEYLDSYAKDFLKCPDSSECDLEYHLFAVKDLNDAAEKAEEFESQSEFEENYDYLGCVYFRYLVSMQGQRIHVA